VTVDWWDVLLKYQTGLPQFDPELDETTGYAGVPPVQMASAQNPKHTRDYLEGRYPPEFWAFPGKEASLHHGASPARADERGRFLDVGVRSQEPVGADKKVGRMATPDEMPDKRNIVVRHRSAADHPRFKRDQEKRERQAAVKRKRKEAIHRRRYGLRKEAKSPKALRHKREYETRYESSPERKRYRRDLERERRKRGVAGKGGKDMSHTKRGTIVPEDAHSNRARSHPSVGSTLKSERDGFNTSLPDDHPALTTPVEFDMEGKPVARMPSEKAREQMDIGRECPLCEQGRRVHTHEGAVGCTVPDCYANTSTAMQNSYGRGIHRPIPPERLDEVGEPVEHSSTIRDGMRVVGNVNDPNDPRVTPEGTRIVYGGDMPDVIHYDMPRPTPIYYHGRNTPSYDQTGYFTTGDPMDLSFRMLKDETRQTKLPQELTAGAHEAPLFARQQEAMERKRKQAEAIQRQRLTDQARAAGKSIPLHAFAAQTPAPEDSQRPE